MKPCETCLHLDKSWHDTPCNKCGRGDPNYTPMLDLPGYKEAEAVKFDEDKLPVHLIPIEAMHSLARVLKFGAKKYAERNWEKGMEWHRLYRAAINHLMLWFHDSAPDPESGLSHLDHALACVTFLATYEARKVGTDDRPLKEKE